MKYIYYVTIGYKIRDGIETIVPYEYVSPIPITTKAQVGALLDYGGHQRLFAVSYVAGLFLLRTEEA